MSANDFKLQTEQCLRLLEILSNALFVNSEAIDELQIDKYGRYDDFIYAEFLSHEFVHMHQVQREALMKITREVINSTTRAYSELYRERNEYLEELAVRDESVINLSQTRIVKI